MEFGPFLSFGSGQSWEAGEDLPVDQTRDNHHTLGVVLAMVAVGLSQGLVASQAFDGVFDLDTVFGKGVVELFILQGPLFSTRFTARGGA